MPQQKVSPKDSNSKSSMVKVDFSRNELNYLLPLYYMIRDAIEGEPAIKGLIGSQFTGIPNAGNGGLPNTITNIVLTRAVRYLPQPNAEDKSDQNLERYRSYVTRAVWYPVTHRTLEGMAGQIFLRDPVVEIPSSLDLLKEDVDGGGLSLIQFAHRLVRYLISYGRSGVLVDYPVTAAPATKAEITAGNIRPTLTAYHPWDIINWRTEMKGAKKVLTLIVLRESVEEEGEDGFVLNTIEQYRVLSFDPTGIHKVDIYRKGKGSSSNFDLIDTNFPKGANGKELKEIPFHFVGSRDNEAIPNQPPLYDLASVNIAHYRNSADYEEACFITGQPTPVLAGLTEDWVTTILKGAVTLGSRAAIPLPVGAQAFLLQATANSMPIEAMKHKEEQMVALGAKLVQSGQSAKSATGEIIETTSENSMLANISQNVSHVMEWALTIAASFVSAATETIKYQLNKDFDLTSMTADDQNAVIKQWQSGAISFSEMRTVLRRAGTANVDDDTAKAQIKADIDAGLIPDPASLNQPPPAVPDAKAASNAGGTQPKVLRRQSSPAGAK